MSESSSSVTCGAAESVRITLSARIERTAQIVERSAESGRRVHSPALASADGAAEYVSREWAEDKVRQRYDWLFRYRADEVTI